MKNKEVNKAEATCINSSSFFYLLPIFRILLPIKRCDLPSNSLVWWQHKNTSNFQKMCTILKKSFETTSTAGIYMIILYHSNLVSP